MTISVKENKTQQGAKMADTQSIETAEEKKTIGAKLLSKSAMIFSSFWIAILTILKGLNKIDLEIDSIIYSGIAITAVWTPTFVSIITDKIKDKV